MSRDKEVPQAVSLDLPTVTVLFEELLLLVLGDVHLVEAGLDDAQSGSFVAVRDEREGDERRVGFRRALAGRIHPTIRKTVRTIGGDDGDIDDERIVRVFAEGECADRAGSRFELGRITEPGSDLFGFGDGAPHDVDRGFDLDVAFDRVGAHGCQARSAVGASVAWHVLWAGPR